MIDREIDIFVAEKFLDWHGIQWERIVATGEPIPRGWKPPDYASRMGIPYYSTDPTACDLVLDEIERRGWLWALCKATPNYKYKYIMELWPPKEYYRIGADDRYRAVCLVALRAVGVEV